VSESLKFRHGYGRPILLFLLTVLTTSGLLAPWGSGLLSPTYAFGILLILGAHEFGHYFACRWHNVDCTLPFFIPAPIPMTGTLGAVIRIREPFPSRKALFDIGVAGPLAGFITLLPFLVIGISLSTVDVVPTGDLSVSLGEPYLFKWLARMIHGPLVEGTDIFIHPLGYAAWFGMLATALNLLPFGQLDGGHIAYAVLGSRARYLSIASLVLVVALAFVGESWIVMAVMLTAMAWFMGFRHPAPIDDTTPLTAGRVFVALLALGILIGCFTPEPISVAF
jgi:membrane-associated protease RseP (regulator of RpoE activity)